MKKVTTWIEPTFSKSCFYLSHTCAIQLTSKTDFAGLWICLLVEPCTFRCNRCLPFAVCCCCFTVRFGDWDRPAPTATTDQIAASNRLRLPCQQAIDNQALQTGARRNYFENNPPCFGVFILRWVIPEVYSLDHAWRLRRKLTQIWKSPTSCWFSRFLLTRASDCTVDT